MMEDQNNDIDYKDKATNKSDVSCDEPNYDLSNLNDFCDSFDSEGQLNETHDTTCQKKLENTLNSDKSVPEGTVFDNKNGTPDKKAQENVEGCCFSSVSRLHQFSKRQWERKLIKVKKQKESKNKKSSYMKMLERRERKKKEQYSLITLATGPETYVKDEQVFCFQHNAPVQYWCEHCSKSRCDKCVNLMYSKTCVDHKLTTLPIFTKRAKAIQKDFIHKTSTTCLQTVDLLMKYVSHNQLQTEAIFKKERIKQEFISFQQLLIEEEKNMLKFIDETLDDFTAKTQSIEESCGDIIKREAELMSTTLEKLKIEDPYGTSVEDVEILIKNKWNRLSKRKDDLIGSLQKCPYVIGSPVSLSNIKTVVQTKISEERGPIEIEPFSYTVYLDGDLITKQYKLSDFVSCKNMELHIDSGLIFEVKIYSERQLLQRSFLNLNDFIWNYNDRLHLLSQRRYRLHVTLVPPSTNAGVNILIVTGQISRHIADASQDFFVINCINDLRQGCKTKCTRPLTFVPFIDSSSNSKFTEWIGSNFWLFTSANACKGFFDVSPEEMRFLAYSAGKEIYDLVDGQLKNCFLQLCNHVNDQHGWKEFFKESNN